MQRTARDNVQYLDEPSIIVDPILYACSAPCLLQRVCETFIGFTRVVVIISLAASTGFATAHVVRSRSLGHASYRDVGDRAFAAARGASQDSVQALGCIAEPVLAKLSGRPEQRTTCGAAQRAAESQPVPTVLSTAGASELATVAAPVAAPLQPQRMKRAAGELHVPHLAPLPPAPAKLPAGTAAELANKARQELARGKFDAALALAQRAVDKAPHRAGLHIVLGDVLRLRGDVRAAALQYELAKRLGPQLALDDDRVLPANPF